MKKIRYIILSALSLALAACNDDKTQPVANTIDTQWAWYFPNYEINANSKNLMVKEMWHQVGDKLYYNYDDSEHEHSADKPEHTHIPTLSFLTEDGMYTPPDIKEKYGFLDNIIISQSDEKWVITPIDKNGLNKLQRTKEYTKIDLEGKKVAWALRASTYAASTDPDVFNNLDNLKNSDVSKAELQFYLDTLGDTTFPKGAYCLMENKAYTNQSFIEFSHHYPATQTDVDHYLKDNKTVQNPLTTQYEHYVNEESILEHDLGFGYLKLQQQWYAGTYFDKHYVDSRQELIKYYADQVQDDIKTYGATSLEVKLSQSIANRTQQACSIYNQTAMQIIDKAQKIKK